MLSKFQRTYINLRKVISFESPLIWLEGWENEERNAQHYDNLQSNPHLSVILSDQSYPPLFRLEANSGLQVEELVLQCIKHVLH